MNADCGRWTDYHNQRVAAPHLQPVTSVYYKFQVSSFKFLVSFVMFLFIVTTFRFTRLIIHQAYFRRIKIMTLKRYYVITRQNDDYHEVAAFLKFFKIIIIIMCEGKAIWVMHISTGSPISSWLLFQLETARHKRHDSHFARGFFAAKWRKAILHSDFCQRRS